MSTISLEINVLVGHDDRSTNLFVGLKVKIDFDHCYNSLSEVTLDFHRSQERKLDISM